MSVINKPLTNLQLELMKLFSLDLSEEELNDVRQILSNYFAKKASNEMDRLWDENNWSDETMDNWLEGNN
ncbi:hypothetical protein [Lewinella cohaerens]|uniref:hypothetical protein n=1 Tax=Lewinella cohaerens TaxID=70995 RepID=UPI0003818D8D|nr:hypothetical protein [Lewinella cohaerens]